MTTENSTSKKQKVVDLPKLAQEAWEHYRNYLDSMEDGEDEGDIDELQAIIDLLEPYLQLDGKSPNPAEAAEVATPWKSVVDLLPVLVSVAYNNLAEAAIAEYLHTVEHTKNNENRKEENEAVLLSEKAKNVQTLLQKSLRAFSGNAATWSMGANFGRMSHRLSLATTREWYEMAVSCASSIRAQAVTLLEDETIEDPLLKEWTELMLLNHMVGVEFEDDDEEDNNYDNYEDNNKGDKQIDEAEEEGHYSVSAVEATARFMCAMLWSMQGDHDKAVSHLQHFDVTHRLHPNVWNIAQSAPTLSPPPKAAPLVFKPDSGVLPKHLYDGMRKVFAPDAPYWKESNYAERGYYSFFMEHDPTASFVPRNLIEDVIVNHLLPRAQQTLDMSPTEGEDDEEHNTICGFEWWTHTRPIQANLGHNLHFDTDEAILAQEGKVTHPILSSVLYVTGGDDPKERPSGSTIVLEQTPDSTAVAEYCWQGTPHDNSFMVFPGNWLHGVLPCPGKTELEEDGGASKETTVLWNDWIEPKEGAATEDVVNRLTFMVGFWTRNVPAGMKDRRMYGPCGPLPPATEEHSWVQQISRGYAGNGKGGDDDFCKAASMVPTALPRVSPAWEVLPSREVRAAPTNGNNDKSPEEDQDTLTIPYGIDHRFFVKGAPTCFRDSLFEDKEDDDGGD